MADIEYKAVKSSTDHSNLIKVIGQNSNVDGDSTVGDMANLQPDDLISAGDATARSRTGLTGLEAKVKQLESQGGASNPEYVRLKAKLDKKNLRRQARAAKKNIRKFGSDATIGATDFMKDIDQGSVGETQSRIKKRFGKFLERTGTGDTFDKLRIEREKKITQDKLEKERKAKEIEDELNKNKTDLSDVVLSPGSNPDYNVVQKRGRPFIAHTNSITAGQPIRKMLKNFR